MWPGTLLLDLYSIWHSEKKRRFYFDAFILYGIAWVNHMVAYIFNRWHGIPFIFQFLVHSERLIGHFYHYFEGTLLRKYFELVMSTNIRCLFGLVRIKMYAYIFNIGDYIVHEWFRPSWRQVKPTGIINLIRKNWPGNNLTTLWNRLSPPPPHTSNGCDVSYIASLELNVLNLGMRKCAYSAFCSVYHLL